MHTERIIAALDVIGIVIALVAVVRCRVRREPDWQGPRPFKHYHFFKDE